MTKQQSAGDLLSRTPDNEQLLEPGWAGELSPEELAFIKAALKSNPRLRAKWGLGHGTGRLNDEKIRIVAMCGPLKSAETRHKCSE